MNMREALERIAKYPVTRGDDLSIESARQIAREALEAQVQQEISEIQKVFEEFAETRSYDLRKDIDGKYIKELSTGAAWDIWQAALAAQAQQPSEEFKSAALLELYNFQEATGCDVAAELKPQQLAQAQQPAKSIAELKKDLFGWAENLGGMDDALALFADRVLQSNAQAQQESQWISVEEGLPDHRNDVLCFVISNHGDRLIKSSHLNPAMTGFYVEYEFDEPTEKVTHWMPLPPAPEGDKEWN